MLDKVEAYLKETRKVFVPELAKYTTPANVRKLLRLNEVQVVRTPGGGVNNDESFIARSKQTYDGVWQDSGLLFPIREQQLPEDRRSPRLPLQSVVDAHHHLAPR
eukprot:16430448-Heterocapsa_arctica.AAC.1